MKWQYVSVAVHLWPEVSLHRINVPWILNGQQWKIILSLPLNAVTTQTTTTTQISASVLNVFSHEAFLPMHALHCVSSHCDRLTDVLFDPLCSVSHSDSGCWSQNMSDFFWRCWLLAPLLLFKVQDTRWVISPYSVGQVMVLVLVTDMDDWQRARGDQAWIQTLEIIHPVFVFESGEVAYCGFKRLNCHFHLNT